MKLKTFTLVPSRQPEGCFAPCECVAVNYNTLSGVSTEATKGFLRCILLLETPSMARRPAAVLALLVLLGLAHAGEPAALNFTLRSRVAKGEDFTAVEKK